MTTARATGEPETSLTRNLLHAVRYHLRGRRGFLVLAAIALVAGLVFKWGWLVATGIAPLLLTALPCVAMCALGLCMNRTAEQSCSTATASQQTPQPTAVLGRPGIAGRVCLHGEHSTATRSRHSRK